MTLAERWLEEALATPGITGLRDLRDARRILLEDALRAAPVIQENEGRIVDVGSGGGSPGLPLAMAAPERDFTLLEAERRKCRFLERFASELANATVVWGRAEAQPTDSYGVALAKALARPPVAVELCLPLVEAGGAVVLWAGDSADVEAVSRAAAQVGGQLEDTRGGLLVVRKIGPTPPGFPRRAGMAKKRPLA